MFFIILAAVLIRDRSLFIRVDYFLLLTFVCFFIFIGNMERIPAISGLLWLDLRSWCLRQVFS